jgi:hypothetical protein
MFQSSLLQCMSDGWSVASHYIGLGLISEQWNSDGEICVMTVLHASLICGRDKTFCPPKYSDWLWGAHITL